MTSAAVAGGTSYGYRYDPDGDLIEQDGRTGGTRYANYDNADEECLNGTAAPPAAAGTGCPAAQGGDATGSYDGAGNTLSTGQVGWSYNDLNQVTGSTVSQTPTSYRYADEGNQLLTKVTTGSTTTTWTNGMLGVTGTQVGSGTPVWFTRTPDGQLISMRSGTGGSYTSSYYLTDQQGSVLRLTDSTGNTDTAAYSYDPYGTTVTSTGSQATVNPYRYATGLTVDTTGDLKLGARYYRPTPAGSPNPTPATKTPATSTPETTPRCTRTRMARVSSMTWPAPSRVRPRSW